MQLLHDQLKMQLNVVGYSDVKILALSTLVAGAGGEVCLELVSLLGEVL